MFNGRPALGRPFWQNHLSGHSRLGLGDLLLDRLEIEARAFLHRREFDRGFGQLENLLLDENEAPEFVLEPIEILLRSGLGPALRPSRTLEWIKAKVGQIGHVNLGFFTKPSAGLVDETILVVVDANGAQLALTEYQISCRFDGPCR